MNVFIIGSPFDTAVALDKLRLNKQIIETRQILDALGGKKAWSNHPATLQYAGYKDWLKLYKGTLEAFQKSKLEEAARYSFYADLIRPSFHTEEFFAQMKRRLYTKNPTHYAQWADLDTSLENWYWSPKEGKIIKYINGKRL